jgi:uncharacterized integral membrane protein
VSAGEEPEGRTEDAPGGRSEDPRTSAREAERERRGSGRSEPDVRDGTATEPEPATPLTQQVGRIIVAIVAVLFLIFSFFNVHEVDVDWLITETETPLIVLLIGAFLIGLLVGAGIFWRRQRVRTRLERRDRPDGS